MPERNKNRKHPIGLYIEPKFRKFYLNYDIDIAELMFNTLKAYGLETVNKSMNTIPIVIESFEPDLLKKFGTLSDLPLVLLMSHMKKKDINDINGPDKDFDEIATYAHGVAAMGTMLFEKKFMEQARKRDL